MGFLTEHNDEGLLRTFLCYMTASPNARSGSIKIDIGSAYTAVQP